jgi:hypothetical protein
LSTSGKTTAAAYPLIVSAHQHSSLLASCAISELVNSPRA